jgi:uncharacterized NAD(P)/FAD-binding protein YdhS
MPNIVIIGGGYSGITCLLSLVYLIKSKPRTDMTIFLYEKNNEIGGLAYGHAPLEEHLMNVPIKFVNPLPIDVLRFLNIDDLLNWIKKQPGKHQYTANDFCPRVMYGHYLQYVADRCAAILGYQVVYVQHEVLHITTNEQTDTQRKIYQLTVRQSQYPALQKTFDGIILATGYSPYLFKGPTVLQHLVPPFYIEDMWQNTYDLKHLLGEQNLASKTILVIGSGLSAMDIVVSLYQKYQSGNFKGRIILVSRHGLLHSPIINGDEGLDVDEATKQNCQQLSTDQKCQLFSKIMSDCATMSDIVASAKNGYILANYLMELILRDQTLNASKKDEIIALYYKSRFTDVFITGMPQATAKKVCELIQKNILTIHKAEIKSAYIESNESVRVELSSNNQMHRVENVNIIINATGDSRLRQDYCELIHIPHSKPPCQSIYDSFGHFTQADISASYIPKIVSIGPIRANQITRTYGTTHSTARSIIELRLQAFESCQQLLCELDVITSPASPLVRYPELNDYPETRTPNRLNEQRFQANYESAATSKNTTIQRLAVLTPATPFRGHLISDMTIVTNQLGTHPSQHPDSVTANIFIAGETTLGTGFVNANLAQLDHTAIGTPLTLIADTVTLASPNVGLGAPINILALSNLNIEHLHASANMALTLEDGVQAVKRMTQPSTHSTRTIKIGKQQEVPLNTLLLRPILQCHLNTHSSMTWELEADMLFDIRNYQKDTGTLLMVRPGHHSTLISWLHQQSIRS